MSSTPEPGRSDAEDRDHDKLHLVRGVVLLLVLGPVFVVSAAVAATALLSTFLAGLNPTNWFSSQGADWLFGSGVAGDAGNYLRFMVGGGVAAITGVGIRWGFKG